MTKKHFNALAEQLASVRPPSSADAYARQQWLDSVRAVARACREFNPAFDANRFIAACRGEKA